VRGSDTDDGSALIRLVFQIESELGAPGAS
jgi:hypothetical protein